MPENRATNTSSKPRLTDEQVQSLADRIRGAQRASAAAAELRTQAFRYIGQGNVTGLDRLFDQGLSPNVKDEAGRSLMHAAASPPYSLRGDNVEMLEYLIARGMSANVRNNKNQTPVFLAMQRRIDLKDYHLFDDFSPAEPTYNKQLHLLVSNSRYPDRWPGDGGLTLLHVAALDYDAAMVQRLLKSGFPSDLEDERGRTAYDIALKKSPALAALFPEHAERGGTAGAEAVKRASECTDKALIPESQMERYRAMVAAGALTFCEAD